MVAAILAARTGFRCGSTRMLVPSRTRSVTPATRASVVSGSRKGTSGASGNLPVGLYG